MRLAVELSFIILLNPKEIQQKTQFFCGLLVVLVAQVSLDLSMRLAQCILISIILGVYPSSLIIHILGLRCATLFFLILRLGLGFPTPIQPKTVTGDFKTVSDAYTFLMKWFEAYPEFLSNPLYIGGESYSGYIVPMLAHKIADGIEVGAKPILNIKGYLIGNGMTDKIFGNAQVPFAHGMALIPNEIYEDDRECGEMYNCK
ncbi:hypothetical protein SUGI_0088020 [Cryptomeria japonica]|nr:hypothetical protein SUGI_0088020 [Cryptomeria japonica]